MKVQFSIPGEPQGKERPRFSYRGQNTYTPAKTQNYERLVALQYKSHCRYKFDEKVPLLVGIRAYFSIPKSVSKKVAADMRNNKIRPTKRPDVDNIIKIILDSLNDVAYHDDAQVVECVVLKFYSDNPKVDVTIQNIEKED